MERAGDSAAIKKALRLPAPATAALEKFIEASEVIRQAPMDGERVFSPKQLIQCTLPHSNPGDVPVWTRKNGNFTLGIVPGVDLDSGKSIGFPYGTIPRLLLFWLTREVLRTGSRRVNLSGKSSNGSINNSLSAFMNGENDCFSRRARRDLFHAEYRITPRSDLEKWRQSLLKLVLHPSYSA